MKIKFIGWLLLLMVTSLLADRFLPYRPSFPYSAELLISSGLPKAIYSMANFDGVHYLTLIEKGYLGTGLIQAFFPIYPGLVWLIFMITSIHPILIGLGISIISFYLSLLILKKIDPTPKTNFPLVALVMMLFPTSFFFAAMYGESLFLLLTLSCFLMAKKKNWLAAGLLAALASATRVVGILLVFALFIELFESYWGKTQLSVQSLSKFVSTHSSKILFILIGSTGLIGYMIYLNYHFSDPLYFLHVQEEFGGGRSESLILYPQVIVRYLKILITARPFDLRYYTYVLEFISGIVPLAILALNYKIIRKSYLFFSIMAIIIPTLTGTFSSLPRYVLVCFPIYFLIANKLEKSPLKIPYLVISTILLIMSLVMFVQGYWVA